MTKVKGNITQLGVEGSIVGLGIKGLISQLGITGTIEESGVSNATPVLQSIVVENATPTIITLTYDIALDEDRIPDTALYTINDTFINTIEVSGTTVLLNLDSEYPCVYGTTYLLSYDKDGDGTNLHSFAGVEAASFTEETVTNNVEATYPAILDDGNTVGWYLADDLANITKDGSGFVSAWNDFLTSGHDLLQAVVNLYRAWDGRGKIILSIGNEINSFQIFHFTYMFIKGYRP